MARYGQAYPASETSTFLSLKLLDRAGLGTCQFSMLASQQRRAKRGCVVPLRFTWLIGEALLAPFRVDISRKMSREDVVSDLRCFCL